MKSDNLALTLPEREPFTVEPREIQEVKSSDLRLSEIMAMVHRREVRDSAILSVVCDDQADL